MKIKFIVKKGSGCDWHRLFQPLDHMTLEEGDTVDMGIYGESTEDPGDCDIYMFNRDVTIPATKLLQMKKERGFKIVMDLDDYWILPPSHYLYEVWDSSAYSAKIISYMLIADVVTVTNERLADFVKSFCKNILIYPNAVPFDGSISTQSDKMRFLYAGGITHLPDVKLLDSAFRRIGDEPFIHNKSEYILCGFDIKHQSDTWDGMAKVFSRTKSFRVYGQLPLDRYMEHYENADVCLVPLVENTFNSCKSTLKMIEAASQGKPCIVSEVLPYTELKDAPAVLWASNTSDWLRNIRFCLKNPKWVEHEGLAFQQYMKERYNIVDWAAKRYNDLKTL